MSGVNCERHRASAKRELTPVRMRARAIDYPVRVYMLTCVCMRVYACARAVTGWPPRCIGCDQLDERKSCATVLRPSGRGGRTAGGRDPLDFIQHNTPTRAFAVVPSDGRLAAIVAAVQMFQRQATFVFYSSYYFFFYRFADSICPMTIT